MESLQKERIQGHVVYRGGREDAPFHLIWPLGEEEVEPLAGVLEEIGRAGIPFSFTGLVISDWNRELSPWEAPAVFGKEGFGKGAGDTLDFIRTDLLPGEGCCILGGYSLAGLFALWASTQPGGERFAGIAAASPSVWFPGWQDHVRKNPLKARVVYLSLGDREERTRNPVMSRVGEAIRELAGLSREREDMKSILEWNKGGHFQDPGPRTARAFAWTLEQLKDI